MKDTKKPTSDFDVVAHWRERAENFRKLGRTHDAAFADSQAHSLEADRKRKEERLGETASIHADAFADTGIATKADLLKLEEKIVARMRAMK